MWRQIGQEMAALGDEDSVRQELMGWMGQVPKVLQAKQSESSKSVAGAKLGVILPDSSLNGVKNPTEAVLEDGSKTESAAEKSETAKNNAFVAKQVSKLVEQYEAQETAQREWEENFEAHQTNDKDEVSRCLLTTLPAVEPAELFSHQVDIFKLEGIDVCDYGWQML